MALVKRAAESAETTQSDSVETSSEDTTVKKARLGNTSPSPMESVISRQTETSSLIYHTGGPGTNMEILLPGQGNDELCGKTPTGHSSGAVYLVNISDSAGFNVGNVTTNNFYQGFPDGEEDSSEQRFHERRGTYVDNVRSESERYRAFCQKKTDGSFVETTQCKRAKEVIEKEDTLLIIGHSGYGKSSFLNHISGNHMKGYLPIPCKTPKEIKKYIDRVNGTSIQMLFVVDEPCGGSFIQEHLVNSWLNIVNLEMYLDKHKFLFATRTSVWTDCAVLFANSSLFCNRVEFTPASLTDGDKREMIRKYLGNSPDKLADREMDTIVSIKNPVAFCQCCKLMGDAIKESQSGEDLVKIFEKPFSYLISELELMKQKETVKYATLCLVALCGDIQCRELTGTLSQVTSDVRERIEVVWEACGCKDPLHVAVTNIRECAENLCSTFLDKIHHTREDSMRIQMYTFSHDSLHEAVTMHFGNRHFRHCLQFLPHDLLVRISRPQNYIKDKHEFVISVPDDVEYNLELAKIFTEVAIVGNWGLHDVFQNPFVREENFQQVWVEYLKSDPDKLAAFIESKSWDGECVRHLSHRSGAYKPWRLLRHDLSVRCTCRRHPIDSLSEAASRDDKRMIRNLITSHKQTDAQIHRAFLTACKHGSMNVLDIFLQEIKKYPLDDTVLMTGLKEACRYGQREVVGLLLERYYSPCKKDKCECRLGLIEASMRGQTEIVLLLLSHGTDINITDNTGQTGLHWAAGYGRMETVQKLLDHGADINITDMFGWTCIHYAVWYGYIETVQKLLDHGANINIRTKNNDTALDLAQQKDYTEIADMISKG